MLMNVIVAYGQGFGLIGAFHVCHGYFVLFYFTRISHESLINHLSVIKPYESKNDFKFLFHFCHTFRCLEWNDIPEIDLVPVLLYLSVLSRRLYSSSST